MVAILALFVTAGTVLGSFLVALVLGEAIMTLTLRGMHRGVRRAQRAVAEKTAAAAAVAAQLCAGQRERHAHIS